MKALHYYSFDWDNNILNMNTKIHADKRIKNHWIPIELSTEDFATHRVDKENYRIRNNNPDEAFVEFRDYGPRAFNAFLEDVKYSISKGNYAPSWGDFIECLVNGNIFSIITARGHETETIRGGVEYIIDNCLSKPQKQEMYDNLLKFRYLSGLEIPRDKILKGLPSENSVIGSYLDLCDFIGVSNPKISGENALNPEKAKEEALLAFISKVNNYAKNLNMDACIGFSDDDLGNVRTVESLFDNIHHEDFTSMVKYVVKNTNDPDKIEKSVRVFEKKAPGMDSSIVPHLDFSNEMIPLTDGDVFSGEGDHNDAYGKKLRNKKSKFIMKRFKDFIDKEIED